MRIVLVGASGFFGRFLLNRLVDDGHHCVVLTRAAGRHGNLGLMRNVELVQADVYDVQSLATVTGIAEIVSTENNNFTDSSKSV